MAYYHCILFDVDGTLLDFEASESKALVETLTHYNWPTDAETQETYRRINRDLCAGAGKNQERPAGYPAV